MTAKAEIQSLRRQQATHALENLKSNLPEVSVELASERGASSWLSALLISDFGFKLHKGAFCDALALRYGWALSRTPSNCECGAKFTVDHAFTCSRGGFPILRHNEIRDLTANLLTEVYHEVITEQDLQPLSTETFSLSSTNTQDGARLDTAVNGFWGGRYERTFCDVRVFNPHAPSNSNCPLPNTYRKHEREKKNTYERRILEVEHASFTPLIFSATGGMASSTRVFYQRLASMLAIKWGNPYGPTMSWLNCRLVFSLLRSAIRCIRGAHSSPGHPIRNSLKLSSLWSKATNFLFLTLSLNRSFCTVLFFLFICLLPPLSKDITPFFLFSCTWWLFVIKKCLSFLTYVHMMPIGVYRV